MKFIFSYEILMKHRASLEEKHRKEYLESKQKSEESLKALARREKIQKKALASLFHLQKEGNQKVRNMQEIEEYIKGEAFLIEEEKKNLHQLLKTEKEKREVFLEALKDLRVLETLKEKKKKEFEKEQKKLEMKELENIVIMGFRKK